MLAGLPTHSLLEGGSRSGKTSLFIRAIIVRAHKAKNTRHAALRYRFGHAKESIGMDTFPKVMRDCFPHLSYKLNQSDWFATFPASGSELWIGGLDDKDRTEKVLGKEFATILLNECSQISYGSRNMVKTRLAQSATMSLPGAEALPLRMYYDINPTTKAHWTYRLFHQKVDPETRQMLMDASNYQHMLMNPLDNAENLPAAYLHELQSLPARLQRRFWLGQYGEAAPNALFSDVEIDKWRVTDGQLPVFQRVVIAVDPSGSGDTNNADNDAIGIIVVGLGTDGNGYVLEDLTVKAGPAKWGSIATSAFERHSADVVVGEVNYGGEMVKFVIQTARPRTPYKAVTATRGKVVRAEPFSSLVEQGKIRLVGYFPELEEELAGFTTNGYTGDGSPNRADAFVWAFAELFPGIIAGKKREVEEDEPVVLRSSTDWGESEASGAWMG